MEVELFYRRRRARRSGGKLQDLFDLLKNPGEHDIRSVILPLCFFNQLLGADYLIQHIRHTLPLSEPTAAHCPELLATEWIPDNTLSMLKAKKGLQYRHGAFTKRERGNILKALTHFRQTHLTTEELVSKFINFPLDYVQPCEPFKDMRPLDNTFWSTVDRPLLDSFWSTVGRPVSLRPLHHLRVYLTGSNFKRGPWTDDEVKEWNSL